MQNFLQDAVPLDEWSPADGTATGERLVAPTTAEAQEGKKGESTAATRVRLVLESNRGLQTLSKKHVWLEGLLVKVLENKLWPGKVVNTALVDLSERGAKAIGASFSSSIAVNLTNESGVDEWILKYPALVEIDGRYSWFRPMLEAVAQRLLEQVSWGLKMRVSVGAGVSMLDLISDIVITVQYFRIEGQQGYALGLLMCILVTFFLQGSIVFIQNYKGPRRVLAKELLILLSGTKPGIDAARVVKNSPQLSFHMIDRYFEHVAIRVLEVFGEAIPGCVYVEELGERSKRDHHTPLCLSSTTPLTTNPPTASSASRS
jgi:hypothetical protein